jgi:DNA (cytosine-5)-methyltransferase 1
VRAYYNEIDGYAAQWLRNLIAAGLIVPGDVDERSIVDVSGDDLAGYRQCHFFAGIGGWSYALHLAGWGGREVWTGSCPCQPLSSAGQRKGHADERHLWPAFYRLIAECNPATIFGEQVASKDGREWLAGIRADLEDAGYAVGAADLCAAGVGAPHIRQRLFWVADTNGGKSRNGYLQSSWEYGQQPKDGSAGGVADAHQRQWGRLAARSQCERDRQASRRVEGDSEPQPSGATGGLGDAKRGGQLGAGSDEREHAETRRSERNVALVERQSGERRGSFWSAAEWLPSLDGKARRIEPGTFPLVARLSEDMGSDRPGEASPFRIIRDPKTGKSIGQAPNRVGMLRDYGNAISPWNAAEFVRAFMKCEP